jgi:hypothetical protein
VPGPNPSGTTGVPFPTGSGATGNYNSSTDRLDYDFPGGRETASNALKQQFDSLQRVNRPLDLIWNANVGGASPTWRLMLNYSQYFLTAIFLGWGYVVARALMRPGGKPDWQKAGFEVGAALMMIMLLSPNGTTQNLGANGRLISETLNWVRNTYEEAARQVILSQNNGVQNAALFEAHEMLDAYRAFYNQERLKCDKLRSELAPVQSSNNPATGNNQENDPYITCLEEAGNTAKNFAMQNSDTGYLSSVSKNDLIGFAATFPILAAYNDVGGNYKGYTTGWSFWNGYSKLAKDYIYFAVPAPIFIALGLWNKSRRLSLSYLLLLIGIGAGPLFYTLNVSIELAALGQNTQQAWILMQKDMDGAFQRAQLMTQVIAGVGGLLPIGGGLIGGVQGLANMFIQTKVRGAMR